MDPLPVAPTSEAAGLAPSDQGGPGPALSRIDKRQARLSERQARDEEKAAERARKSELAEAARQAKDEEKAAERARKSERAEAARQAKEEEKATLRAKDEEKAAQAKLMREQAQAARRAKAEEKAARQSKKREEAQAAYIASAPKRLQAMAALLGIRVKDGFVYAGQFGSLSWVADGSQADLYTKDDRGQRVTLARVALTGIFALGLQKKTGKLVVIVEISGDGWSVTGRTENVERAHTFVTEWNNTYGRRSI
jgi:hypothetical protein